MFKKYLVAIALIFPAAQASAECVTITGAACGPATSYEITVEQVEFCQSAACTSPYVVASSSAEFDIASSAAGGAVGNYADLDEVPAGVYTHVRTTIDGSITYSAPATTSCSAQTNQTLDVTTITGIGTALGDSANAAFNLSVSGTDLIHEYELSRPLAISKSGSLPQVQIDFSTADGHLYIGSTSYPGVPFVEIQIVDN